MPPPPPPFLMRSLVCSQSRHGVTAFFTCIAFLLLLQLIHMQSCWSYIDVALGALPIQASRIGR